MTTVEMDMLRSVCRVYRTIRVRNTEICERCGVLKSLDQRVKCFDMVMV